MRGLRFRGSEEPLVVAPGLTRAGRRRRATPRPLAATNACAGSGSPLESPRASTFRARPAPSLLSSVSRGQAGVGICGDRPCFTPMGLRSGVSGGPWPLGQKVAASARRLGPAPEGGFPRSLPGTAGLPRCRTTQRPDLILLPQYFRTFCYLYLFREEF